MNMQPTDSPLQAIEAMFHARVHVQRQEFEQASAAASDALRINPQFSEALMLRAAVSAQLGNYRQALSDVEHRLQIEPTDPAALLIRGNLRAHADDVELAIADFNEVLQRQPGNIVARRARSLNYTRLKRWDEGLADLTEALRLDSANASSYVERGRVYQHMGSYRAAVADYEKALELDPDEPRNCNQFAWMLAACPREKYRDGKRAVQLAQHACELTDWRDGNLIDTLACAHAECGQFDDAIRCANDALKLAESEIGDAVRGHLELFQAGRAVRFEEV